VAYDADDPEAPADGLLREVRWSEQVARGLGAACGQLVADQGLASGNGGEGQRINPRMEAWTNERMNHAELCKMALDADIQPQQLDISTLGG
jgi:hypothetical protein